MKKIIISLLIILSGGFCFAQKNIYSYDGISFYKKGLVVKQQLLQNDIVQITAASTTGLFSIIIQKSKSDGTSAEKFLEDVIEIIMDNGQSTTNKGKFNVISSITDSNINGIETKYVVSS
jgi:hypothetical protein